MTIRHEKNRDHYEHNTKAHQSHEYVPETSECTRCAGPLQEKAYQARCGDFFCIKCVGIWGDNLIKCDKCHIKDVPVQMKVIAEVLATVPACICFECFYDV